jgi:hypothetical protein
MWSGPHEDNKLCLNPADASLTWVQDSQSGTSCLYKIHVPMGDPHATCADNGDCSALPTTDPPALPVGNPGDCCCCGPDDKTCFVEYRARWNCDSETWTAGGATVRRCLPRTTEATGTWEEVPEEGGIDFCIYRYRVPCGGACMCCEDDGDCSECVDIPPDTPTGDPGGTCCSCACEGDDCFSCGEPGQTPAQMTLGFALGQNPDCSFNPGSPFNVDRMKHSLGVVVVTQTSPCLYEAAVDVRIERCEGDGTGCDACGGGENIVTSATLQVNIGGGAPAIQVLLTTSDPLNPTFTVNLWNPSNVGYTKCCRESSITVGAHSPGFTNWYDLVDGEISITPC